MVKSLATQDTHSNRKLNDFPEETGKFVSPESLRNIKIP